MTNACEDYFEDYQACVFEQLQKYNLGHLTEMDRDVGAGFGPGTPGAVGADVKGSDNNDIKGAGSGGSSGAVGKIGGA